VLTWSGEVLACCRDANAKMSFGNVFKKDIYNDIWNSRDFREFRKSVNKNRDSLSLCSLCNVYGIPEMN